jgi:hypothetical protein
MNYEPSICVISICSLSHEHVWKLTSQLLPKFIQASEFIVYVPEEELVRFYEITDPAIKVLPNSLLGLGYNSNLKLKIESVGNSSRYGWYLQQFHKIEALTRSNSDISVIWDADCVPVKKIELIDLDQKLVYMNASEEVNPLYFIVIERLLGMNRVQNQSFVVPGFPILKNWICEFIEHIELYSGGLSWYDAIITCTDFSHRSGFSETETLGTWIANTYPNSWATKKVAWERGGQNRFGYAKNFTADSLLALGVKESLEIISFENWDLRGWRWNLKRLRNRLAHLIQHN